MDSFFIVLILLAISSSSVYGYPNGATEAQCVDMAPSGHGVPAQTIDSPYDITLNMDYYMAGTELTVTITGGTLENLKGFLLQARQAGTTTIVDGEFTTFDTNNYQTVDCSGTANALTHLNNEVKDTTDGISFTYTAPSDCTDGDIEFVATIVEAKETFWMGVKSSSLNCMSSEMEATTYSSSTSNVPALFTMLLSAVTVVFFYSRN